MSSRPARLLVPILLGVLFAALPVAWAEAGTAPTDDDGSGPSVPESTIAPPATDPEDAQPTPPDDGSVGEDDGQSALVMALGIAGSGLLVVLAGRWMIRRSDPDDWPPAAGPPDWPEGDLP
jgi:hypothetical protein